MGTPYSAVITPQDIREWKASSDLVSCGYSSFGFRVYAFISPERDAAMELRLDERRRLVVCFWKRRPYGYYTLTFGTLQTRYFDTLSSAASFAKRVVADEPKERVDMILTTCAHHSAFLEDRPLLDRWYGWISKHHIFQAIADRLDSIFTPLARLHHQVGPSKREETIAKVFPNETVVATALCVGESGKLLPCKLSVLDAGSTMPWFLERPAYHIHPFFDASLRPYFVFRRTIGNERLASFHLLRHGLFDVLGAKFLLRRSRHFRNPPALHVTDYMWYEPDEWNLGVLATTISREFEGEPFNTYTFQIESEFYLAPMPFLMEHQREEVAEAVLTEEAIEKYMLRHQLV